MRPQHLALPTTDTFLKHILIVFFGTTFVNIINLAYQLLIAHRLTAPDFAAFNSLISVLVIASTPLLALQTTLARYLASYRARADTAAVHSLLRTFLKGGLYGAALLFLLAAVCVPSLLRTLKIESGAAGALLAVLIGISCLTPVATGMLQGLERFSWLTSSAIIAGCAKLVLAFILIEAGYRVTGALGAFVVSIALTLLISFYPLRQMRIGGPAPVFVPMGEILRYCIPIAAGTLCFQMLTNLDMLFVRRFFPVEASGTYALAQMVGKVFLFLPGAISIVMFPKTSGLKARKEDTRALLSRSLLFASTLCAGAALFYNLWPSFVLKLLTGKSSAGSVFLGRFFSVSMSLSALLSLLVTYFLSVGDLRFMPFVVFGATVEVIAFVVAGALLPGKTLQDVGLLGVQAAVISLAGVLFVVCLLLAFVRRK